MIDYGFEYEKMKHKELLEEADRYRLIHDIQKAGDSYISRSRRTIPVVPFYSIGRQQT